MRERIIKAIASIFYLGHIPIFSGTLASILAIGVYSLFKSLIYAYLTLTIILILLGFLVCSEAEIIYKKKDSKRIIIDDFCGMLSSFILFPRGWTEILGIFLIFRILDFLKPYPADRLERLRGSIGIMSDDLVAAFYTNLIYLLFLSLKDYFRFAS